MGKGGSSGSAPGCGRLMSFMVPLCVQRPNYGNNQWMGSGGSSGWGSIGGGWGGFMAGTSGYYPNSMGMNNYLPSYTGSGYGAPSTAGYGTGYGTGYGSGYDTGTNQWNPWSYDANGWTNNWPQGGGHRKGKTGLSQADRQQVPPTKVNFSTKNPHHRNPTSNSLSNHNFSSRIPTKSVSASQVRYPGKSTYNPTQSSYNPSQSTYNPPQSSYNQQQQQSSYTPNNPNSKYDDIIVQQEIL